MPMRQVLIVEDEPDLAVVFANLLEIFGLKSVKAKNAQVAREILSEHRFDFCIIDLTLPDLPGIDLYREMISHYPQYRGKVVFTSGFNVSDELTTIMDKDGTAFLAKPFTMEKLKKVIERWL